jgi:hypothetical protein
MLGDADDGVTEKAEPLQMSAVMGCMDASGLTFMVSLNGAPLQPL